MIVKVLLTVLGLAIGSALAPAETRAAEPSAIVQAFNSALNARDVDAALALLSDEAIIQDRGQTYTGRTQIREWIVDLSAQNISSRVVGPITITGDTVVLRQDILVDEWRSLGLEPLPTRAEIVVRGDLIHSFASSLFPVAQSRLQQALAREGLPRTGGLPPAGLATLAVSLIVAGLRIRRP